MAILPTSQAAAEIESPDRPKRKHLDATSPANSTKRQRTPGSLDHVNPLGIRPLGNLLLSSTPSCRGTGLGSLAALPDELLLLLFSEVPLEDLHRLQGVSRTFFAWCAGLDSLWKAGFIERAHGRLGDTWAGSWRETYLRVFLLNGRQSPTSDTDPGTGRLCVRCEGVFSDVLFQPIMCAQFAFDSLVRSPTFRPNISCVSVHSITSLPMQPLILTDAMSNWDAYSSMASSRWSLDSLAARFPDVLFRAEATLTTLSDYSRYQASCFSDESPLYLFDSDFVEKTEGCEAPGMGRGFEVPKVFSEDLFSVLGDKRPDFRWLVSSTPSSDPGPSLTPACQIVGPARSGSTWHQDPNHTSAWNAPITGSKMWILFPPHVLPPGVRTSPDMGEVECPLSIAEWFLGGYYDEAKEQFGEHGKEEKGAMKIGICRAGEIFYVPSGWWHREPCASLAAWVFLKATSRQWSSTWSPRSPSRKTSSPPTSLQPSCSS